jgi:NADH dehydrogenase FAD-containing subunit
MKNLVLLGTGQAHVHVLSTLAAKPVAGVQITVVAPAVRPVYPSMLAGYVAGHHALEDCSIALEPLLKNTGIRRVSRHVNGLDAAAQTLTLDDGSSVPYDFLSINTGPVQERQSIELTMPGAREHGLFVRPSEAFGALWPQVAALADQRALRVAVIGEGVTAIELSMAIRHRMPNASVTLITGGDTVGACLPAALQHRVMVALKQRNIIVLADQAVGLQTGQVALGCGGLLACDVPLVAVEGLAPVWLADSGLALDERGFVAIDACCRATRHANVMYTDDLHPSDGIALAAHLADVVAGKEPVPIRPAKNTLRLISCGDRSAIAAWGNYTAQGRWASWLKSRRDREAISHYQRA